MLKLYIAGNLGAATSESILVDPVKINAGLTTGSIEVLDKHYDLLGNISNNIIEFTFLKENKPEIRTFFFRTGIFWIGNKNVVNLNLLMPGANLEKQALTATTGEKKYDTTVLVYGNNMVELTQTVSEEPILKEIERVKQALDKETEVLIKIEKPTSQQKAKKTLLEEELYSFQQLILFMKDYKKRGK
jgi:hypothetical protein